MTESLDTSQDNTGDDSAPWSSVLEQIPSQFREQVTPALKDWATQTQQQYETQYADWKTFIDRKIDPNQIQSAFGLAAALETDPVNTIKTLQQYFEGQGLSFTDQQAAQIANQAAQQVQPAQQQGALDPAIQARFDEMKQQQDLISNVLVKKHQEDLAKQEDAKVGAEFDSLHKKMTREFGKDFNEQIVGGLALATGMNLEQAARAYYAEINQHVQGAMRPAPNVLGTGGGLPTNRPNVRQMGEEELNNYAADFVRNMRSRQT